MAILFYFRRLWYSVISVYRLVIWFLRASISIELASLLTIGLFLIFLALEAYLMVDRVSS